MKVLSSRSVGHLLTVVIAVAIYIAFARWIDAKAPTADLDSAMQLLTQVLAVSVGIMLVGITVYSSSYDASDSISEIGEQLQDIGGPFFEDFFGNSKTGKKLRTLSFRRTLSVVPAPFELEFYKRVDGKKEPYFVYRWDGVWYWTHESPFSELDDDFALASIGVQHEVTIMAFKCLEHVKSVRTKKLHLIDDDSGSNGSIWFWERFKKSKLFSIDELPPSMSPQHSIELVFHALGAEHYMHEEFRDHREEIDWNPEKVTQFYLIYVDYLIALTQFIEKIQKGRALRIAGRFSMTSDEINEKLLNPLKFNSIYSCREKLNQVRKRIITVHGVARYYTLLRRASIPGIGSAVIALFLILLLWPLSKMSMSAHARFETFLTLYACGVAALWESFMFLKQMLTDRASARRRRS